MTEEFPDALVVGRVVGLHGVKGWVKIYSYTRPRENIRAYSPWYLRIGQSLVKLEVTDVRVHGRGIIALLEGCSDRDIAIGLLGADILIRREQLPALEDNEHYWVDLVGMQAITTQGVGLGIVTGILETGANDVLIIRGEREHLIPYIKGVYIMNIDSTQRRIEVDWEIDY